MVVTNNERLAARVRRLRQHGADRKYLHDELGYNSRLDELQAAVLRVKLRHLPAWNSSRGVIAQVYNEGLKGLNLGLPAVRTYANHVYHQYAIQTPRRDELQAFLAERNIETSIHYPVPLHNQPVLSHLPTVRKPYPVSTRTAKEILCLPVTPENQVQDIALVVSTIRQFFKTH
jgi:dTDP-4-amino-4,6-dideoxygalactose transaminase